jgi:hypothetical protein
MSQRRLGSLLNARLHAALPPATVLRMPGRRARALSILFRTKGWLTLAQLLSAWARELADDKTNADHVERNLTHFLIEDMINGRLDDAGPLADGRRLGLRIITPDNRAGYLDGQQARELLMPAGAPAAYSLVSHRLVVMKEAVLDFARRHELPAPSWWADATIGQREQIDASPAAGYRDADEYWLVATSEPMKALSFAHLLAVHLIDPTERLNEFDRRSLVRIRIDSSLRFALKTGESWFIKDPLPSDDGGTRDLEALMLHPRAAAKWLLSRPKRKDLVPPGLKAFLERSERPEEREVPPQPFTKSNRDLGALPSSTLRWRYNLMPKPTKFEIYMREYERERRLAERILTEHDPAEPAAPTPEPTLPLSPSDGAVDLTKLAPQPAQPSSHGDPQRPRGKSQPSLERARGAIKELYPDGVPGQATEPNANLCRRVSTKLQEESLPRVSDDTILRAAGRRK